MRRSKIISITMVIVIAFLVGCSLLIAEPSTTTSLGEQFQKGTKAYDSGDYFSAVETFSDLIDKGYKRPEIYYNLGCAYFKTGSLGQAILNFDRALKLNPSDEDAKVNLEYARKFTIDKIEEPQKGFFAKLFEGAVNFLDINTGLIVSAVLFWMVCLTMMGIIWFRWNNKFVWYIFTILLIIFLSSAIVSAYHIKEDISAKIGVLVAKQADIRTGPGEDFSLQFTAHEGLEFKLEELREGYWRIKLKNGLKGWVKSDAVGIV